MAQPTTTETATSVDASSGEPQGSRAKVFYGWWIVSITFAGAFFATGIHDTVFSVMLKPISEDTGWSRTQISLPISLSIWVGSLLGPLVGRIVDKKGARALTGGGAMIIGTVYFLLSIMGQFWQFFLFYPAGRAASQLTMLGGVPSATISNWFYEKRGRALGIQAMSIGLGGAILSVVATFITANWGWRTVFVVFGICMWTIVVIPAFLFLRRRPEDIGLLPDGATEESHVAERPAGGHGRGHHGSRGRGRVYRTNRDFTVREALRTKALWALIAVSTISSTGTGAIHLHLAPHLTDVGLGAGVAAAVVSVSALMGAAGSLFWGFLSERITPHHGIALVYISAAISVLILTYFTSLYAAFLFAVMFGFVTRGGRVILTAATADYYGRSNIGTIQGLVVPVQVAGLGIGQIVAALIQDSTGSYKIAFLILAAMYLSAAFIGSRVRPPQDSTLEPTPAVS